MNFTKADHFEIRKTSKPAESKRYIAYRFMNDFLLVQYPPLKKFQYRYHRNSYPDSIAFMFNKRLKYAVIRTDSSLIYSGKRRKWNIIEKVDRDNFLLNHNKWKQNYKIKGNEIILGNDYIIRLTNIDSRIEIRNHRGKGKDKILYTIEKISDKLFIYNKNYRGLLVAKEGNNVMIYRNKALLDKYELKSNIIDEDKK
jgi:hypothetical protein